MFIANETLATVLVTLISTLLMSWALWQLYRHKDPLHPIANQAIIVAILLGLRAFYIRAGNSSKMPFGVASEPLILTSLLFFCGFFLLSAIVFTMLSPTRKRHRAARREPRPPDALFFIGIFYLMYGVIAIGYLALTTGLNSFLDNLAIDRAIFTSNYSLYYGLTAPFIATLVFHVSATEQVGYRSVAKILMGVSIFLGVLGALLTGFRSTLFQSMIPLVVYRAQRHSKPPKAILVVGVLALVALLPALDGILYGRIWPSIRDADIPSVKEYYSENTTRLLEYAYGRFYTLEGTGRTLLFIDSGSVPGDDGRLIKAFPRILLPTALVEWKPSVSQELGQSFFSDIYGSLHVPSCITSLPAFFYWQLGWFGYVVSAVYYGCIVRYWVWLYEDRRSLKALRSALLYPFLYLQFTGNSASIAETVYVHILLLPILIISSDKWMQRQQTSKTWVYAYPVSRIIGS
jgi:hypothetical protein